MSATAAPDFEAGREAYRAGDFATALAHFEAAEAAAGSRARAQHALAVAAAALELGQWRSAEGALERVTARDSDDIKGEMHFLAARIAVERAQLAAQLARQVEAEPFAWNAALSDLDAAAEHFRSALDLARDRGQPDWPAARRNWQRCLDLRAAFANEQAANQKPPEITPDTPPPGDPEVLEDAPLDPQAEAAPLDQKGLLELLQRLENRSATKRALRDQQALDRIASGQIDW